jgi:hypothetical protein
MTSLRRLARFAYSRSLSAALSLVCRNVSILAPRRLRRQLGAADTLRIAAPGRSVRSFERPSNADAYHVLGLNYFTDCADVPLWQGDVVFVIEPHPEYRRYAESLRKACTGRSGCFVVIKGISSPRKAGMTIGLARAVAEIPGVKVLLANDLYFADLAEKTCPEAIVAHPEAIVSGSKSLQWTISFAWVAGYRRIVLHGFDFSDAYAYTSGDGNSDEPRANIWVDQAGVRNAVLDDVTRLAELLAERGVSLVQSGCEGPLSALLPHD